ncbi:MAG: monofunctional biosynthetic peptidoglycan transglycosylase [Nitrosomonas sp.]|nr:monofunctional biosynthetic peptidoglycan transglycosylase [Nitrosomonas sp.]
MWVSRLVGLLLLGVIFFQSWFLLHVVYWRTYNPATSAFMQQRLVQLREQNIQASLQQRWIPYEQISGHLKKAVVASEDARFMQHPGFDFDAMEIAWKKNLEQRKWAAGGSTISQQLAKNLLLSSEKTLGRKLQEALITLMLEQLLSKQRILELYLNMIEWGDGVFGAEAAARHYFNVPASALSARQAALLAAMIPNPRYYDKHRNSPRLLNKTRIIEKRMQTARVP